MYNSFINNAGVFMKTTKTIKVSEATGPALDWLVAKCEGFEPFTNTPYDGNSYTHGGRCFVQRYSTAPAPAYPIIEREGITVIRCDDDYATDKRGFTTNKRIPVWGAAIGQHGSSAIYGSQGDHWGNAYSIDEDCITYGPTSLIAAMRCYVTSKLGETAEIPEELL
jgi:hypothetical protein